VSPVSNLWGDINVGPTYVAVPPKLTHSFPCFPAARTQYIPTTYNQRKHINIRKLSPLEPKSASNLFSRGGEACPGSNER